jgi:hypothetical protein
VNVRAAASQLAPSAQRAHLPVMASAWHP